MTLCNFLFFLYWYVKSKSRTQRGWSSNIPKLMVHSLWKGEGWINCINQNDLLFFNTFRHTMILQQTTLILSMEILYNQKSYYGIALKLLWQKEKLLIMRISPLTTIFFQNSSAVRKPLCRKYYKGAHIFWSIYYAADNFS